MCGSVAVRKQLLFTIEGQDRGVTSMAASLAQCVTTQLYGVGTGGGVQLAPRATTMESRGKDKFCRALRIALVAVIAHGDA